MIFQVGTKCVNATYTANADGSVGVWNQAIDGLGKYTSIRGTARVKDPSEPAALVVVFDNPGKSEHIIKFGDLYTLHTGDFSSSNRQLQCFDNEIRWIRIGLQLSEDSQHGHQIRNDVASVVSVEFDARHRWWMRLSSSAAYRRTKTMSPLVVAQLRKMLFDIGADVSQLAPTPQNC